MIIRFIATLFASAVNMALADTSVLGDTAAPAPTSPPAMAVSSAANINAAKQTKELLLKYRWRITIYAPRGNQEAEFREEDGKLMVDLYWLGSKDTLEVTIDQAGVVQYTFATSYKMELKYDPSKGSFVGTSTNIDARSGRNQVDAKAEKMKEKTP